MGKYFEKTAFNAKAMAKVLKAAKNKTLSKNLGRVLPVRATGAVTKDSVKNAIKYEKNEGILPFELSTYKRSVNKIIVPEKGDLLSNIQNATRGMLGHRRLSGKNRKAIDAITKGHELDELAAKPIYYKDTRLGGGHTSDSVLLKEHNKLTTLPKRYAPAKRFLTDIRTFSGEAGKLSDELLPANLNFDFGNSQRLSRHAVKHLTNIAAKKRIKIQKELGLFD